MNGRPNISSYSRGQKIKSAGHVWRAEGKTTKRRKNIVGKIPLGRPRTRWKDVVEKYLIIIHKNVQIGNVNDRDRWNETVVAAMDLHGPLNC